MCSGQRYYRYLCKLAEMVTCDEGKMIFITVYKLKLKNGAPRLKDMLYCSRKFCSWGLVPLAQPNK